MFVKHGKNELLLSKSETAGNKKKALLFFLHSGSCNEKETMQEVCKKKMP